MNNSELNKEYRRCKRNLALCKRMDKKREKIEKAKSLKLKRKTDREYRRCKRQSENAARLERRNAQRLYRGKVIWCHRHAACIDECNLSDGELQTLGRPLPIKICSVIYNIFATLSMPIWLPIGMVFYSLKGEI